MKPIRTVIAGYVVSHSYSSDPTGINRLTILTLTGPITIAAAPRQIKRAAGKEYPQEFLVELARCPDELPTLVRVQSDD